MSRHGFLRWFGWSAAAHLALGAAVWFGLPQIHPANLPASDAAVTLVALIDAPTEVRAIPPPRRSARPASRSTGPATHESPAATTDHALPEPFSDASLPAPVPTEPDSQVSRIDTPPASTDDALPPLPAPVAPVQDSDDPGTILAAMSANAGVPTDAYRPLVLAILDRAKRYPLVARRWGIEGVVDIAFTIHPNGRISDPELVASSMHHVLDDAALAIVRRVRFVPPPPTQTPMRFSALIKYQVDD